MRMDFSTFHHSLEPSFEKRETERERGGLSWSLKRNARINVRRRSIRNIPLNPIPSWFNIAGLFRYINGTLLREELVRLGNEVKGSFIHPARQNYFAKRDCARGRKEFETGPWGFATMVEKKKIMDGDSGKIEFERETRGCKPFKVLYNVILEYQSRNHFSKLKTTLRSIVYPIVSTLKWNSENVKGYYKIFWKIFNSSIAQYLLRFFFLHRF